MYIFRLSLKPAPRALILLAGTLTFSQTGESSFHSVCGKREIRRQKMDRNRTELVNSCLRQVKP